MYFRPTGMRKSQKKELTHLLYGKARSGGGCSMEPLYEWLLCVCAECSHKLLSCVIQEVDSHIPFRVNRATGRCCITKHENATVLHHIMNIER